MKRKSISLSKKVGENINIINNRHERLWECYLDRDGVLKYEIKAPFDKLLACTNYKKWKDIAIENLEELEKTTM